jgi:hypothetical protein
MSNPRSRVLVLVRKNTVENPEVYGSLKSINRAGINIKRTTADGIKIRPLTSAIISNEMQSKGVYEDDEYLIYRTEIIKNKDMVKDEFKELDITFNVGDNVIFNTKKAVVSWVSVRYLDIVDVGTNEMHQGVSTSLVKLC